jgi:hypothetical protein
MKNGTHEKTAQAQANERHRHGVLRQLREIRSVVMEMRDDLKKNSSAAAAAAERGPTGMSFVDLLRAEKPTVAALKEAVEQAHAEAERLETRLGDVNRQRSEILLDGMDQSTLDALDDELRQVERLRERANLAARELEKRLEEAEQRERMAETARIRTEATAAQAKGRKLLERYGTLAAELRDVMSELVEAERAISIANTRLLARDPGSKVVKGVGATHWKDRDKSAIPLAPWSICDSLKLPSSEQPRTLIWPPEVYTPIAAPQPAPKAEPKPLGPVTSEVWASE